MTREVFAVCIQCVASLVRFRRPFALAKESLRASESACVAIIVAGAAAGVVVVNFDFVDDGDDVVVVGFERVLVLRSM